MPADTSEFTLSLFDSTALSGWTHHTPQAVEDPNEADDPDDTTTPPPAVPVQVR